MWANRKPTATFHYAGVFFRNITDPAEMFLNISKAVSVCVHTVLMLSVICMKIISQSSWWVHTQKQHILRKQIYRNVVWLDTDYFNSKHTGECVLCYWFNSNLFTEILRTSASCIRNVLESCVITGQSRCWESSETPVGHRGNCHSY